MKIYVVKLEHRFLCLCELQPLRCGPSGTDCEEVSVRLAESDRVKFTVYCLQVVAHSPFAFTTTET